MTIFALAEQQRWVVVRSPGEALHVEARAADAGS
jgi:hypothetical protein